MWDTRGGQRALKRFGRTIMTVATALLLYAFTTPIASLAQESLEEAPATSTDSDSNGAVLLAEEDELTSTEAPAGDHLESKRSPEGEIDSAEWTSPTNEEKTPEETGGPAADWGSSPREEGQPKDDTAVTATESAGNEAAAEQEAVDAVTLEEAPELTAMSDGSLTTGTWGTCAWSFDAKTGVLTLSPGTAGPVDEAPWKDGTISPSDLTKVLVSGTGKVVLPSYCSRLFYSFDGDECVYFDKLTEIDGSQFDTSRVNSANGMFHGCPSLKVMDVSNWSVSRLSDATSMFHGCKSLGTLDVSRWDTHSLQYMGFMFCDCPALTSLDVSGWDTSRVCIAQSSFNGCSSLKELDVSGWNTSKMELIDCLFAGCASIKTLDVSGWEVSSARQMDAMFEGCTSLRALDLSGWDTSSVSQSMSWVFAKCSSLETVSLSGWNTTSVKRMDGMFSECSSLKSLDLSGWDTSSVNDASSAFYHCSKLEEVKVGSGFTLFGSFYEIAFRDDKWQSKATGAWMTAKEIAASRTGIADTYKRDMRLDISSATIAPIAEQAYTGSAVKPTPAVKVGSKTLKSGTDYTLSYKNNTNAGTATVTVAGRGNYAGTKSVTFKIAPASISGASVSSIAEQAYTGSAVRPTPAVKLGSKTLKSGTDYTLSYKANTKAGTATVTVTGKGNYAGTKSVTFRIVQWAGASRIPVKATARYTLLKGGYMRVLVGGKKATSNSVLSISGATITGRKAGTATVYLYDKSGKQLQKKTVTVFVAHGKTYEFESSVDKNYVLDIQGKSKSNGAQMIVYKRNGGANQKYTLYLQSDGTYAIKSVNSGKYLTVEGKTDKYVQQWAWKGGTDQRWRLTVDSANRITFVNVYTNKCFDVQGGKTKNSAKMIVWQSNNGLNQKWKLNQK